MYSIENSQRAAHFDCGEIYILHVKNRDGARDGWEKTQKDFLFKRKNIDFHSAFPFPSFHSSLSCTTLTRIISSPFAFDARARCSWETNRKIYVCRVSIHWHDRRVRLTEFWNIWRLKKYRKKWQSKEVDGKCRNSPPLCLPHKSVPRSIHNIEVLHHKFLLSKVKSFLIFSLNIFSPLCAVGRPEWNWSINFIWFFISFYDFVFWIGKNQFLRESLSLRLRLQVCSAAAVVVRSMAWAQRRWTEKRFFRGLRGMPKAHIHSLPLSLWSSPSILVESPLPLLSLRHPTLTFDSAQHWFTRRKSIPLTREMRRKVQKGDGNWH